MLLDDVLDWDRRSYLHLSGVGILRKQRLGVAFNCFVGDVGHSKSHLVSILICIVAQKRAVIGPYFSFAFCACLASRAISSAVSPFAARRKSAISRGRWRMI